MAYERFVLEYSAVVACTARALKRKDRASSSGLALAKRSVSIGMMSRVVMAQVPPIRLKTSFSLGCVVFPDLNFSVIKAAITVEVIFKDQAGLNDSAMYYKYTQGQQAGVCTCK